MYNDDQPLGGVAANPEEEEDIRDIIEATDDEGNSIQLEVVRYFFYNGDEYVVLGDVPEGDCECDCEHCAHHEDEDDDCDDEMGYYIMKVVESEENDEEMETFVPVEDEDLLEKLEKVLNEELDSDEELDDKE